MKIKVKANRHVVGLRRGETGWVEDSRKVQSLIRVGYLVRIQDLELPLMSADFDDEPLPEVPESRVVQWNQLRAELDVDDEKLATQREYTDSVIEDHNAKYGPESVELVDFEPAYFREAYDESMAEEGPNIPWSEIDPDES